MNHRVGGLEVEDIDQCRGVLVNHRVGGLEDSGRIDQKICTVNHRVGDLEDHGTFLLVIIAVNHRTGGLETLIGRIKKLRWMNHSANSKCHVYFIKYSFGFPEWNELPLTDKLAIRNV